MDNYKTCDCGREFYVYCPMDVMCEECVLTGFIDDYDSAEFLSKYGVEPDICKYE